MIAKAVLTSPLATAKAASIPPPQLSSAAWGVLGHTYKDSGLYLLYDILKSSGV